ncbi:MAG TPA: Glu-tRNA(Gln) amidotransferase subunit GatE [Candidatus Korarchaeota archaeon]|nr:Glu-tRNA(Gln) amidotransferase subunit GatE [Candidatus Korarchaeota archaeon]
MPELVDLDYRELGLKVGIEIHQRLATREKLFCHCPPFMRHDEPHLWVRRRLRVSYSELGSIDPAARFETLRARVFEYGAYSDSTCEVELDEAPPLPLNLEALEVSIEVALMLNMDVVDEVHVMRKIVVDGSNTTGFQRTALVALGGESSVIETSEGEVRLSTLCLEEESAYIVETTPQGARYRLDRLGIPLIELATEADIRSPDQAREAALKLGRILRATGRVQRGIGSIRQDLNVSIEGGARQEIKGVQELDLISEVVRREALRQVNLLRIRDEMRSRGLSPSSFESAETLDVTELMSDSKSKLVRRALSRGSRVLLLKLHGMGGLLGREVQPNRRFGTELSDYAKVFGGVAGILHSDELPGYGITEQELSSLYGEAGLDRSDAFVLVLASGDKAKLALDAVRRRVAQAALGVPEETRKALPDGNTAFMRPLPGSARMYPETDVLPVVTGPLVREILARGLPEMPDRVISRLVTQYGLTEDLANMLLDDGRIAQFERIVSEISGLSSRFVASTLTSTLRGLAGEGVDVHRIPDSALETTLRLVAEGRLAKEAIPEVFRRLAENPELDPSDLAASLTMSEEELDQIIRRVLEEEREVVQRVGMRAFGRLMGKVMSVVRGRVDGAVVSRKLRAAMEEMVGGQK